MPNPNDKSRIITTNTSSDTTSAGTLKITNINTTNSASNISTNTTTGTKSTDTAVTVNAITGVHPQVHTITATKSTSGDASSLAKPSSCKTSRASVNSSPRVTYL